MLRAITRRKKSSKVVLNSIKLGTMDDHEAYSPFERMPKTQNMIFLHGLLGKG